MASNLSNAIFKTLIYADIFDYPLTKDEIWQKLIKIKIKNDKLKSAIRSLSHAKLKDLKLIKYINGYYFLQGKKEIVTLRQRRKRWSEKKLKIVKKIVPLLRLIPSIKLIGITGAMAINNAKEDDDIDLFIVSSRDLLWTTRLLATLLLQIIGRRRQPGEIHIKDRVCLNMFVTENHLSVPPNERDLFTAHEVTQMKPIYYTNQTYQKFLRANQWVRKYLPNAIGIKNALKTPRMVARRQLRSCGRDSSEVEKSGMPVFHSLEKISKYFQLWYMKKRRTTEVIADGIIRFHPQDARKWVLKKYKQRLADFGL